jgi:hypothetical protein
LFTWHRSLHRCNTTVKEIPDCKRILIFDLS